MSRRATLPFITVLCTVLSFVTGSSAMAQTPQDGPTTPTALSMTLVKSNLILPASSWIASQTAEFHFQVQVATGSATPQVEVEPLKVPFTGQPNFTGAPLHTSGPATVTVSGLADRGTYHWQARVVDASGNTSQWVPYSTRGSTMDLGVDQDPPSRPVIFSSTNPVQSQWYHTSVEALRWRASDSLSGIRGYSWVVGHNPHAVPPGSVTPGTSVKLQKMGDGIWYVSLRAQDEAGNWSPSSIFRLQLDHQPARFVWLSPGKITFNPFRGPTKVQFRVTKDATVALNLYRVGSRRPIAQYHYPHLHGGQVETITWTGKDAKGKTLPKGYYFFSAQARDRAFNFSHTNLGGIALIPLRPHTAVTGQVLYPNDGKRIIVSLSHEALYAYDGVKLVLQTLVTTGNPSLPTPAGHYTVLGKYHPYEFISPWPEGSPYYYAPSWSQYALLFRQGGYFLHDAPWRGAFGPGTNGPGQPGTNYGGTHGCVNIPSSSMTFLFGWASVGTPVDVVP